MGIKSSSQIRIVRGKREAISSAPAAPVKKLPLIDFLLPKINWEGLGKYDSNGEGAKKLTISKARCRQIWEAGDVLKKQLQQNMEDPGISVGNITFPEANPSIKYSVIWLEPANHIAFIMDNPLGIAMEIDMEPTYVDLGFHDAPNSTWQLHRGVLLEEFQFFIKQIIEQPQNFTAVPDRF